MGQSMPKMDKKLSDWRVINTKVVGSQVYQLIEVVSPSKSSKERSSFLYRLLEETRAVGLIEWWTKGSIIKKPKGQFLCVLVLRNK